jgi:hypothetical protein
MAIAYRAGVAGTNASQASINLTLPAGAQAGDRAIFWMELDSEKTVTPPAGWSLVKDVPGTGTTPKCIAWEHEVAGGEPGVATGAFSWTGADFSCGAIDVWSGVATGTSALSGTPSSGTGTTSPATVPQTTTLDDNAWGIFVVVNWQDSAEASAVGTERTDTGHGASYDFIQATAGATGTKAVTHAANGWAGTMFALKPDAAGATAAPFVASTFNAIPFTGVPNAGP